MLVHFIAPAAGLKENIDSLREIANGLKKQGHTLATEWIEDAYKDVTGSTALDASKWQAIIEDNFAAIAKADVIIAEVTYDSTALGYQIATAVQQKKPTLLLLKEGKSTPSFTWNIPSEFLKKVEYSKDHIAEKITPFLEENDITIKDMRFNFFIDRPIYNYLRWAALKTGKTKAEILRELVQREIENKEY
jgi:nucleoside 2-deoxyribosyltransferase